MYASTLCRPSVLIIHRFALLGILDRNGIPGENRGIVAYDAENVLPLRTREAGVIDIRPATMPSSARTAATSAAPAVRWAGVGRRLAALPFAGMRGIARRHAPACMPAIAMACAPRVWPPCQGSGAGLQAAVRTLQYVMQQAGVLLMFIPALAASAIALAYRGVTRPSW